MRTIGLALKEARERKRYSLGHLEELTKIKKVFLASLEKEEWTLLPEFPVVVGFVKNITKFLEMDERGAVALLRRDYPPKKLSINPKPDVSDKFTWSPKFTFLVGTGIIIALLLGYLGVQYIRFISPPPLRVTAPTENQIVKQTKLEVNGKTSSDATVKINNQPVLVSDEGEFSAEIGIFAGTKEIIVQAISRSGKETVVRHTIKPELGN
jgi:cytoskeletal protein RodZ